VANRTKWWVTIGLMVGVLVAALDATIVDTAFPRMITDLHGESIFTWVITTYMLASTAIVPVVGKLADIYGRKVFYLTGIVLFVVGSMLCGAAQDMVQLILFRGLQGIGGGMLMPIAFTIIGDIFPGAERAKMQGVFGAVWGLASVIGPKLGGWITTEHGWRWIFYVNLPVGIAAFVIMFIVYKESKGTRRPVDWLGSFTVTAGIVAFLLALARGGEAWTWTSWQSLGLFGAAVVLLGSFLYIETKVPEPVLDLSNFRNRTYTVMNLAGFVMGAGMFGAIVYIPWFIQGVIGVDPNVAGNVMTPMMMTMVVFSILAGRLALAVPYRYQITAGLGIVGSGYYLMAHWSVTTTQLHATLSSMVVGAGLGLMLPIMALAVQNAFPASKRGAVTSANTFFRQVGATVGVTAFGVIFNNQMAHQFQQTLAPMLAKAGGALAAMPPQAAAFLQQATEDPQALVRILLSPEAQASIPEPIRAQFIGGVKEMMANSVHAVYWTGLGVALLGILLTQFLGNVSLKRQAAEQGGEVHLETPVMAE